MNWKTLNIVILFCMGLVQLAIAQPEQDVRVYIARYHQLAMSEQQRTGVPAAIKLAQGIYESAAGTSDLASRSNNHFGIKCKSTWRGDTVLHDDDMRQECFRKYPSVEKSYMDHSDFLKGSPRYANLFKLELSDYMGWATGLKLAGYATNPAYVRKITDLIERYNLQQYTLDAMKGTRIESGSAEKEWLATKSSTDSAQELVVSEYKGLKGFWASKGQLLLDKAVLYNVKYSKLLYLNDLMDGPLPNDMFIFIEPKRSEGQSESHLVREGESMQLISQKEAIRLDSLMAYNHLLPKQEVMPGERVVLQGGKISYPKTRDNQVAGKAEVTTIVNQVTPTAVVPKVETPKAVVPDVAKVETPVVKVETPKAVVPDVAKVETPVVKVETPKAVVPDVAKVETPVVKVETPKAVVPDVAKVETPVVKVETPKAVVPDVAKVETPVMKVETPKAVVPVVAKVETPKVVVNPDTPKALVPMVKTEVPVNSTVGASTSTATGGNKVLAVAVPKTTTPVRDTVIKIRRNEVPQTAAVKKETPLNTITETTVDTKGQKNTGGDIVTGRIDTQRVVRKTQPASDSDILDLEKARRTEALLSSNPLTPVKTITSGGNVAATPTTNQPQSDKKNSPSQQPPVKRNYNDPNLSAPVKDLKQKFDQIVYDPAPIPKRDTVKPPAITTLPKKESLVQKPTLELPPHLRVDTTKPKPTPPPVRMRPAEVIVPTTNYDEPNVSDTVKNLRKKFDLILNTPLPERPYKESPAIQTPKPAAETTTTPASKPSSTVKPSPKPATTKPTATKPSPKPAVKPKATGNKPKPTQTKTTPKKTKK